MAEEEVVTLGLFEEDEKVPIDFGDQFLNERCRRGKMEEIWYEMGKRKRRGRERGGEEREEGKRERRGRERGGEEREEGKRERRGRERGGEERGVKEREEGKERGGEEREEGRERGGEEREEGKRERRGREREEEKRERRGRERGGGDGDLSRIIRVFYTEGDPRISPLKF